MASVAVYIQGSDSLGRVFGDTTRLKTAVYTLPSSVSALTTAVQRSSGAVLVLPEGYTTTSTSAQVASALEKLAANKEPVVAYLGEGKQGVFLNSAALAVLKTAVVQEPVAVPTRTGDEVPGAETFAPSPTSDYVPPLAARALANVDVQSQLDALVAQGTIKTASTGKLFVVAAPAPAQVADYSNLMVSSPVSDGFQGSPSSETAATTGAVAYYNPTAEAAQVVQAQAQAAGVTAPAVVSNQTQAQSVTNSWWLWLIVVIILVILLIVSVVLYYRR